MKNIQHYIILIIVSFSLFSCEEVIDVNLDTAPPKLVIDASIKWEKGTTGATQKIKLTTSTDFYSNTIPAATGATVVVSNISMSTPIDYTFTENGQTGNYICTNFTPVIGDEYLLSILYNGQTYEGTSTFMATPVIAKIEQKLVPGFEGGEEYEVKFYFQDNGAEDNFYLVGANNTNTSYAEYGALSDGFFQGNLMFSIYREEDLAQGNIIEFSLQGISEPYFNYMNKLLNIAGSGGKNPFGTAPATLRGNMINKTNSENFPFGYFQLSEIDTNTYTIQ